MSQRQLCKKDCKDRKPGCHSDCVHYILNKAELEADRELHDHERGLHNYQMDQIRAKKDSSAKRNRNHFNGIHRA